jgi:hypothetical protein
MPISDRQAHRKTFAPEAKPPYQDGRWQKGSENTQAMRAACPGNPVPHNTNSASAPDYAALPWAVLDGSKSGAGCEDQRWMMLISSKSRAPL